LIEVKAALRALCDNNPSGLQRLRIPCAGFAGSPLFHHLIQLFMLLYSHGTELGENRAQGWGGLLLLPGGRAIRASKLQVRRFFDF